MIGKVVLKLDEICVPDLVLEILDLFCFVTTESLKKENGILREGEGRDPVRDNLWQFVKRWVMTVCNEDYMRDTEKWMTKMPCTYNALKCHKHYNAHFLFWYLLKRWISRWFR